jgi:polysaccharide pyruvyl transferase WcaK-like protein
MVKIAILDTNSSDNKGSMGRLEGMINCLSYTIPKCKISVFHRYFDLDDSEFIRLKNKYPDVYFQEHLWFNEKNSFITSGIYFIFNSLKFNFNNIFKSGKFSEFDAFVDLNFIEPEKLVDKFSLINFIGVLFVLFGLKNILSTKRPVIVCSATIGPYDKFLSILAMRFLNNVDLITFRERYSLDYMAKLKVYKPKQVLTADLAFLMDTPGKNETNNILEKLGININDKLVGVTPAAMVNSNFNEEDYIKLFSELSNFIINELNYKIIYLANTHQDVYLMKKISNQVNQSENIISFPFEFSAPETKGIISACDLFICSRFHALVASTSLAVPSIGIVSYSYNKFHGILGEMMQQEDYLLDIDENFNYDEFLLLLKSKVTEILNEKNEIKTKLKEREKLVKNQVLTNGKLINEII